MNPAPGGCANAGKIRNVENRLNRAPAPAAGWTHLGQELTLCEAISRG